MHVLELFVSGHCPGSGDAIDAIERFCAGRRDLVLITRDVAHALARARAYRLFTTPALVIDGRHVMYGVPSANALMCHCGGHGARQS